MELLGSRKGVSPILAMLMTIIVVVATGSAMYGWVAGYAGTQITRAGEELVAVAATVGGGGRVSRDHDPNRRN